MCWINSDDFWVEIVKYRQALGDTFSWESASAALHNLHDDDEAIWSKDDDYQVN